MTFCIVAMNRTAAALAADSTVSIPYRAGTKHFQGVSKVMAANSKDPVAVMVYGSPDFAGIPWEVVVEEFREEHRTSQNHVRDHTRVFFEFLERLLRTWVKQEDQDELADMLFIPMLESIEDAWNQKVADFPSSEHEAALAKIVQEITLQWKKTRRPCEQVLETVDVTARVTEAFKDLGGWTEKLTPAAKAMIVDAANWSTRQLSKREQYFSGVVFAGYGAKQQLPALSFHLVGVPYAWQIRKKDSRVQEVSARRPAVVAPFAETKYARIFLEGIDPSIRQWYSAMVNQQAKDLELSELYAKQLNDRLDQLINNRSESIITAVSYLPKAGLAEFAESLVRITAVSLRMSMVPETVGEPIDVAVLSRGDGLVWVKRTPYFSQDLQPPLSPYPRTM